MMVSSSQQMPFLQRVLQLCQQNNPLASDRIARLGGKRELVQIYGMRILRVYDLGDEVKKEYNWWTQRVAHIRAHELNYLNGRADSPSDVTNPFYSNKDQAFLPSTRGDMVLHIQQLMTILPNPFPEIRASMFHMIPKQDLFDMAHYFNELQTKMQRAVGCVFGWLGEGEFTPASLSKEQASTPTAAKQTLYTQLHTTEWVEMQMFLLRHEVYPGVSYYDAVNQWSKEQASTPSAQATKQTLYTRFLAISPLFAALTKQAITPLPIAAQIAFTRDAACTLPKKDTFQTYVARSSQESMLRLLFKAIGDIVENLEVDLFRSAFISHFEREFADCTLSPYILYFVDAVSRKYQELQKKNTDFATYNQTLHSFIVLLQRLLCADTGQLLPSNQRAFALSLGILFYVHIVCVLPRDCAKSFKLADCATILDYVLAHPEAWVQPQVTHFNGFVRDMQAELASIAQEPSKPLVDVASFSRDMQRILVDFSDHEKKLCLFLWVLEHFGLQPPRTTIPLSLHIDFIEKINTLTGFKIPKKIVFYLLHDLCLTKDLIDRVEVFDALKVEMIRYIRENRVDLPGDFFERFGSWIMSFNEKIGWLGTDEEIFDNLMEISSLFMNSFLPKALNWRYSPFLLLASGVMSEQSVLQSASSRWPDSLYDFAKEYLWARHFNGYLFELYPDQPAMCCSLHSNLDGNVLSILWVHTLSHPITRRIEVALPQLSPEQVLDFYQIVGTLCAEYNTTDDKFVASYPLAFLDSCRDFCKKLKPAIRQAVLSQDVPIITMDETKSSFLIAHPKAHEVPQAFQVSLAAYQQVFTQACARCRESHTVGSLRLFECTLVTNQGACLMAVDFELGHTTVKCEENRSSEGYGRISREKYKVTMRLSDLQKVEYSICYETLPTPSLLCWQLALLQEHFYRLYPLA